MTKDSNSIPADAPLNQKGREYFGIRLTKAPEGECAYCDREREREAQTGATPLHPPHDPSRFCESGKRPHCTCDWCF